MILSAILPGLRDVRLPLSVGLTWFMVMWILRHDDLPVDSKKATGVLGAVYDLVDRIGTGPSLAVLVFVAYLLGLLLTVNFLRELPLSILIRLPKGPWGYTNRFVKAFNLLDDGRIDNLRTSIKWDADAQFANGDAIERLAGRAGLENESDSDVIVSALMQKVVEEQSALGDKLRSQELRADQGQEFGEYDRRRAESEFRQAMSFPLAGVFVACFLTTWDPSWLLGLMPVLFLWYLGVRAGQAARSYLITAVLEGQVQSDVLVFIANGGSSD